MGVPHPSHVATRASSRAGSMARERAVWVLVVRPVCGSLGDLGVAVSGGKQWIVSWAGRHSAALGARVESLACREGP